MLDFVIHFIIGLFFIFMGIQSKKKKEPVKLWANISNANFKVTDISAYNQAVGKMWIIFGINMILLGLIMFLDIKGVPFLIYMLGVLANILGLMIYYTLVIEKKYRKQ